MSQTLSQVVDAETPLVDEQRWGFAVARLRPVRKQEALVRLVPQILVEIRIGDLLKRLNLVHRNEVAVQVHKLDAHLLERTLRQQVPLDARERLVRIVVRLLDEPKLLALILIQPTVDRVVLLEPLERQNQQLRVVLVG